MIRRHKLQTGDYQGQNNFCQWLRDYLPHFLENPNIGEEGRFALNTSVNTHNFREYAQRGKPSFDFVYQLNVIYIGSPDNQMPNQNISQKKLKWVKDGKFKALRVNFSIHLK